MYVDGPDSLRAYRGPAAGPAPALVAPGEGATAAWPARLAAACGLDGALWRALPTGDLPDRGFALLVCRAARVSPYAALRDLTAAGLALPGPVACVTLGGDALQGQHGRRWRACPGNLHLSVAFPCDLDAAVCAPPLPMLPAVAACEAVEAFLGPAGAGAARPGIKWVNDVVLAGGKLGGVLTAARAEGPRVKAVFFGLGLNLAAAPELPPDPFALPAVALGDRGPRVPLATATDVVMRRLGDRLAALAAAGPGALVDAYRRRCVVIGREVGVWPEAARHDAAAGPPGAPLPAPVRRGRVEAVGPDLSLRLAGQDEPVREGCLRLLADPGAEAPPDVAGPWG